MRPPSLLIIIILAPTGGRRRRPPPPPREREIGEQSVRRICESGNVYVVQEGLIFIRAGHAQRDAVAGARPHLQARLGIE